ncbi:MAG: carbohydrate kinase family protein [Candidatus Bathyarchaeota archaeon]|nr:carbohydrate kinase family protein [Candidatus Bathyarchaeota archaeon]
MSVLCSGSYLADILIPGLNGIGPPGSLTYAPKGIHLSTGGHSANVAIDLVKLGQSDVHSVGCVGDDNVGDYVITELKRHGVNTHPQIAPGTPTAKNVALIVKDQDRRFIAELTANTLLKPEHVKNKVKTLKPVLLYQGTVGGLKYIDPTLTDILRTAHEVQAITLVDAIMPTEGWGHLREAFHEIDILHVNLDEAESITGQKQPKKIIGHFLDKGVKLAIISIGDQGLTAGTSKVQLRMPAFNVAEIDPTGAGDALCAGVINAFMNQNDSLMSIENTTFEALTQLLLKGQAAGAACVTGIGATTSVSQGLQENLIREQGQGILKATAIL